MTLTSRQCALLRALLEAEGPATVAQLASAVQATPRAVRYDLAPIERWLHERDVLLTRKSNWGVLVNTSTNARRQLLSRIGRPVSQRPVLSRSGRLGTTLLALLTSEGPVLVKELSFLLGVARCTVLEDLDRAQVWLNERNLALMRRPHVGLFVTGGEFDWRESLVDLHLEREPELQSSILQQDAGEVREPCLRLADLATYLQELGSRYEYCSRLVDSAEGMLGLRFDDNAHADLAYHILVVMHRVQRGKALTVAPEALCAAVREAEYRAAETLAARILAKYGIPLKESEQGYIAMQIRGAKVSRAVTGEPVELGTEQPQHEALEIAQAIVTDASLYLHPFLQADRSLIRALALHLDSVLSRLRFGLRIRNPLLPEIKAEYPYVFQVARRSSRVVSARVHRAVPETELGYIAMHLGAAMERLGSPRGRPWRVLVICNQGVATAWLLVSRLQAELQAIEVLEVISASKVAQRSMTGVDLIVSTVPLRVDAVPVVVVKPLLTGDDVSRIRALLRQGEPGNGRREAGNAMTGSSLAGLLTGDSVQLGVRAESWQEAVFAAARPLLIRGAIEPRYIKAMEQIIAEHGPYMLIAPGVALLHARPADGVRETCASLSVFRPPVYFGHTEYDPVHLAFVLGAIDAHSHLRALSDLVELLHNAETIHKIRQTTDPLEVLALIAAIPPAPKEDEEASGQTP